MARFSRFDFRLITAVSISLRERNRDAPAYQTLSSSSGFRLARRRDLTIDPRFVPAEQIRRRRSSPEVST